MSKLDTVDDVFYYFKRYFFPTLFLIAGIYTLGAALTPQALTVYDDNGTEKEILIEQSQLFLYGSLLLILGSVIWFLFLLGIIKSLVGYIVMGVLAIASAVVLYYDYAVVAEEVDFNNRYSERETEIRTRILDIKAAEVAYRDVNGIYTNSFEDLANFVKNGEKMDYIKNGSIPERQITIEERAIIYGDDRPIDFLMNEKEATFLARLNGDMLDGEKFERDTIFVSVLDAIFHSKRYNTSREKLGGLITFHPDSMQFVPFSGNFAELDTGSVPKGDIIVPTLRILMTHPMKHPINGFVDYSVGALDDNHLRQSWD
jgi:hypothetical protein